MQFLFLLIVNIILWAVFYLVISLKLERSASEFREKRMRREMDAVIKDFNETAERNISLLENRITAMKRLMRQSGAIKELDVNIGGDITTSGVTEPGPVVSEGPKAAPEEPPPSRPPASGLLDGTAKFYRSALNIMRLIIGKGALFLLKRVKGKAEVPHLENEERTETVPGRPDVFQTGVSEAIRKDLSDFAAIASPPPLTGGGKFDEADITGLFEESKDKYALISELHGKGCPLEMISRCSGVPAGEIRLVLNLHGKQ